MARWAAPRSRSTYDLTEMDEEPKKIASTITRWLSSKKLSDEEDDKKELVERAKKQRSDSRRRSSIKEDIARLFSRRTSLPVVQLRPPIKEEKAKPMPVAIEEYSDTDSLAASPPLAPFLIVDRSLLPPPPPPPQRRFSFGNLLKK